MSDDNTVVRRGQGTMRNPIEHTGIAPDFRGRKLYCIQIQTGMVALSPGGPPVKTYAWILVLEDGERFNINEFETEKDGVVWAQNLGITVTPGAPVNPRGNIVTLPDKEEVFTEAPNAFESVKEELGESPKFCPECGKKTTRGAKFCASCGVKLA